MENLTFEKSFEKVKSLVQTFRENLQYYTSKDYLEAQVRKDFIDKFFIALGWDVNHEHQKNPYAQEVKVERTMQIGDNPKYADYSFCLAPDYRSAKFLVEAKKPSHDCTPSQTLFRTESVRKTLFCNETEFHKTCSLRNPAKSGQAGVSQGGKMNFSHRLQRMRLLYY